MDLEKFPRVEFWNDTQWEAYKEDVQNQIRRKLNRRDDDLEDLFECKLDLDDGTEDWIYTAHFFQLIWCPPTLWIPSIINDGEGGRQKAPHQSTRHLDLWAPKSQDK